MHYYQFNIGDYRKDTGHLSLLEHGIYRSLIDSYYLNEGGLLADDAKLMRTHSIRTEDAQKAYKNVINDFFREDDGYYINDKCEGVMGKIFDKSQKARESAQKRWEKKANGKRTHSERNATGMLPNTHNPIPNNPIPKVKEEVDYSKLMMSDNDIEEVKRIRHKNSGSKKISVITQRVVTGLTKEFDLARNKGMTNDDILTEWETRGWKSFKAEWVKESYGHQANNSDFSPAVQKTINNIMNVELD